MRTRLRLPLLFLMAAVYCSGEPRVEDTAQGHQEEWIAVLERKKAAVAPNADPKARQVYADSLAAFLRRHPRHSRASQVYQNVQLEFARELAERGRYRQAVRVYRAVLARDPENATARSAMLHAVDRLAVSRERLLEIRKGMSEGDVAELLGKPLPGWSATNRQRGVESWYYQTTTGGLAGVYFREGKVFAAEERSDALLASR